MPFLGEVPASANVRESGDAGLVPQMLSGEAGDRFREVAGRVGLELARGALAKSRTPTLEVL